MIKKIAIGFILVVLISNCFAGYSSGGRSGFSGGSRSYSSARSSSGYSTGRSGYSRSSNASRAYVSPRSYTRSYSGTSSNTVIHNNYSNGGYGFGGSSFFHGMLGGYLGGMLSHPSYPVIAGTAPVVPMGQGMLMEQSAYVPDSPFSRICHGIIMVFFFIALFMLSMWAITFLYRSIFDNINWKNNRW